MKYFWQKCFASKFIEKKCNPGASRASYETHHISGSNVREMYPAWDLAVDFHALRKRCAARARCGKKKRPRYQRPRSSPRVCLPVVSPREEGKTRDRKRACLAVFSAAERHPRSISIINCEIRAGVLRSSRRYLYGCRQVQLRNRDF